MTELVEKVAPLLAAGRKASHPVGNGERLVGFVLPEKVAGLSDGLFMLDALCDLARAAINAMPDTVSHDQSVFDLLEPLAGAISANGGPDIRGYFARATGGVDGTDLIKLIADRMGDTARIAELEGALRIAVEALDLMWNDLVVWGDLAPKWNSSATVKSARMFARTTLEDTKQGAGSND